MSMCPVCGKEFPSEARFCSSCGAQLRSAGQSQRVRKQVTVLFTDLVDSTALGRRLDNEPYGRVLERFLATARQVLERHHGVVQKYVGDAVMAVFGLPQVHDDDALGAVKAAVELHAEIRTLNAELRRDWGVELRVHTAISTGGVVVEEEDSRELGVAADHINLVANLIKLAEADMILIDQAAYREVRGVVRAEAMHLPTLGYSGPVFSVLGLSARRAPESMATTPDVPQPWTDLEPEFRFSSRPKVRLGAKHIRPSSGRPQHEPATGSRISAQEPEQPWPQRWRRFADGIGSVLDLAGSASGRRRARGGMVVADRLGELYAALGPPPTEDAPGAGDGERER